MVTFVLIIIFGVVFSYFATLNTDSITIDLGFDKLYGVPIYLALLMSFGVGLFIAALIYLVRYMSSNMTLGEKEKNLKDANKRIAELTKEVHKLELENTKLASENGKQSIDEDSL